MSYACFRFIVSKTSLLCKPLEPTKKINFGLSATLGSLLGRSWGAFGRFRGSLGCSWAALGSLLAALGPLLAALGPLLGRSGALLGSSWGSLGRSWGALVHFRRPKLAQIGLQDAFGNDLRAKTRIYKKYCKTQGKTHILDPKMAPESRKMAPRSFQEASWPLLGALGPLLGRA